MQQKLFDIKPIRVARPTAYSIDLTAVYFKMAQKINKWEGGNLNDSEIEYVVGELKDNFDSFQMCTSDGYELARDLERNLGFDSDRSLVEAMDSVSYDCYKCLNKHIEKWVEECNITPKYSVGDEVRLKVKNVEYIGEVIDVNLKIGRYTIFVPELGHVREGVGTHGTIKDFEEIEDDFFDDKHWK